MFEFIRTNQLNIMFILSVACMTIAILLLITDFISKRRKRILIMMELTATFLLYFDRMAYVYSGKPEGAGYVMSRVSNFAVFFLTSVIVWVFNRYLRDLLQVEGKVEKIPKRVQFVNVISIMGMIMVVISQFTHWYYSIDANNIYHRGPLFLLCYVVPVVGPLVQYTVVHEYRKSFGKLIYTALSLYIFVPIVVAIIQIFAYGISIVNMAMVIVSILMYVFAHLDINQTVKRAHKLEMNELQEEKKSMKRLFDQTATAFVIAVEKRDAYAEGHAERVADYARKLAVMLGKNEEQADEVYYAALLHDVGMIAIPDSLIGRKDNLTEEELAIQKNRPIISGEILANIKEYPYLREAALYCHERYDGTGYPTGMQGKTIPEIARIIAVADAFDSMTSQKQYRDALPYLIVREEFIKGAGSRFDPDIADLMVQLMDREYTRAEQTEVLELQDHLSCNEYREEVTVGIPLGTEAIQIMFTCKPKNTATGQFSSPSIILFDSYDRQVHDNKKAIEAYHYVEYGEIWFDGHYISTSARNIEVNVMENHAAQSEDGAEQYTVSGGRFEDHVSITMTSAKYTVDIIIALPDKSKASYIGLTGEHCELEQISVEPTGVHVTEGEIKKIVEAISYIDRMESDIPNVQIDRPRIASTEGIPVKEDLHVAFHTMSLPSASHMWHCPYIILFYSDDGRVNGKGYEEYVLLKLNGEETGGEDYVENKFIMKKSEDFPGWEQWKEINKVGMESAFDVTRKGNHVTISTNNLGIYMENTTIMKDTSKPVYVALTGDQVALTDIRIRNR